MSISTRSAEVHQVRHGETVYGLSRKYGVAMDRLLAANPSLRSPDLIHVGSALMVPVLLYHRNPPPASLSLSLRELNSPRTRATFDLVPNYGTSSTQKVSTPRRRPVLRVLPDANVFPTKPYTGSFLTSGLEVVPKNGSSRESRPSPKRSVIAKASMQVSETTVSETSTQSVSPARDLNVALDIVSTSKAMVTAAIAHVREDVIKKGVNTIQYFKEQRQRYTPTEHNIFTKVFYFVNVRTPLVIRSDIDKQLAIVLAIATKQMRQPAGKAFQEVVCNMHNIKTQAGKSATRLMMRTPLERDKKIMKVIAETDMTIESIASKHGISVPRLQQLNRMDDDVLKVGQELLVYEPEPVRLPFTGAGHVSRQMFQCPVQNSIVTSAYGMRWGAMHEGLDLAADTGTPIVAAQDGRVEYSGWCGGYGRFVEIVHDDGFITRYGHCDELKTRIGETVKRGELIATVGSTGKSTGPHLHFEVRQHGRAKDPYDFLTGM